LREVTLDLAVHDAVHLRLARADQRYTALRRTLVETLSRADRPLTIPELLAAAPSLSQSGAYRNVAVLVDLGVVDRIAGTDDHGRYELAEQFAGHHHHLVCDVCGLVEDLHASPKLERALAEAARVASEEQGYAVIDHRVELSGQCPRCRAAAPGTS
jgi:Fe2+ or Zn2+ uptake regulation protein